MKRILLIVILLTALLGSLQAEARKGLGFHFGTVSANGFSYRYIDGKNGWQGTIGALSTGNNENNFSSPYYDYQNNAPAITLYEDGRKTNFNFGINYLHILGQKPNGNFYVFGGTSWLISRKVMLEQDYILQNMGSYQYVYNGNVRKESKIENKYYIGGGLGFELKFGSNFSFAAEMPMTVNQEGDFKMYIPQAGIYYFFD